MNNNNIKAWQTRHRQQKQKGAIRLFIIAWIAAGAIAIISPTITTAADGHNNMNRLPRAENKPYTIQDKKLVAEFIGEVSAYTAGRVEENDNAPCIGAWNNDVCAMVKEGKLVFANNYYKNGTIVCIDTVGCGEVRDRMNSRYSKEHFDIAGLDLQKNLEFGRKNLTIRIYKK